nr:N-carbamoylputrescine amidase [Ipomoea batatas]
MLIDDSFVGKSYLLLKFARLVTVAALQFPCTDDVATNAATAERLVRAAHENDANIILIQVRRSDLNCIFTMNALVEVVLALPFISRIRSWRLQWRS